jgi:hypothetical protein
MEFLQKVFLTMIIMEYEITPGIATGTVEFFSLVL